MLPPSENYSAGSFDHWKRFAKKHLKRTLRRGAAVLFPGPVARAYRGWLLQHKLERRRRYTRHPEPGLLSILTPVWNGSPLRYLRKLANAIASQNKNGACEWVLLDNGCRDESLLHLLAELTALPGVKLIRSEGNCGITRGLHHCLEAATGRYVLPVDADDLLDDDALVVVASALAETGYPPLLYTDEDKIRGTRRYDPYRKPDWDPVLLLNSAYTAHLGVIDRALALRLGAYTDPAAEGSPDWDLFVRFILAGHAAVHIPEIIYSWRSHALSTADDSANKPYIASSQRAVLSRYLDGSPAGHLFSLEPSALWEPGSAHWHFSRKKEHGRPTVTLSPDNLDRNALRQAAHSLADRNGLLLFIDHRLHIINEDWPWEAQGILDLHPETVLVGGRIWNDCGTLVEAGLVFDAEGHLSNPHRGLPLNHPGYFGQLWKQRSVDAVSSRLAAVDARFLVENLARIPHEVSVSTLGIWLSACARVANRRVVYSPFITATAIANSDPDELMSSVERDALRELLTAAAPS